MKYFWSVVLVLLLMFAAVFEIVVLGIAINKLDKQIITINEQCDQIESQLQQLKK